MTVSFKKIIIFGAALLFAAPFSALAVNDVNLNSNVNFPLLTFDTAASTAVVGLSGGLVTRLDVQANYIDITLDNLSSITFTTLISGNFLRVSRISGTNYTISPACPTTSATLTGTGATAVLRLEVFTVNNCSSGGGGGGGGGGGDITPPVISNINVNSITQSSANITWDTNESSSSGVSFGQTVDLGQTVSDGTLAVSHAISLTGLTAGTTYFYKVCSRDLAGNESCSGILSIGTLVSGVPAPSGPVPYSVSEALATSPNINIDKGLFLPSGMTALCVSGSLIKLPSDNNPLTQRDSTVYYCGADSKRHPFPDQGTYFSWYPDFSNIQVISSQVMATIPLGSNVTYRPGVWMIKFQSDPRVYAIAQNGTLRWVTDEVTAVALYGTQWNTKIKDISDAFLYSYTIGAPITLADVIPASIAVAGCTTTTTFTNFMSLGSTDPQVRPLQVLLQCLGFFPSDVAPTGIYSQVTVDSVIKFQTANGIDPAGYVGPATRVALNSYAA